MVSSKKRRTPVTGTSTKSRPSSTKTRSVVRKFHVLLKSRRKLEGGAGNARELDAIDGQINDLGGLDAYQRMSEQGQSAERGGGTETVLIDWLKDIVGGDPLGKGKKLRCVWAGPQDLLPVVLTVRLRLLEVGALKADNYRGCSSWIDTTPIDLNAQDPKIRQQDFLQMKEDENACRWDVLSISLVLNFVPDPRERGMKVLPEQILPTSDVSREDATAGSFVSRCFTRAHRLLVRDRSCRSASAFHWETGD